MSIAKEKTSTTCKSCGKKIDVSTTLAHLIFHVSSEYNRKYGTHKGVLSHVDDAQIHDLILSDYDDPDLEMVDEVIENIVEKFKVARIVVVYKYGPFANLLNFSERTGYIIHTGDHEIEKIGKDKQEAIRKFIALNNDLITKSLKDDYYTVSMTSTPTNTCQWVSFHAKVPTSWLGVPVVVQPIDDIKEEAFRTRPVKCGNSTHVTVPLEWSDRKVSVTLAYLFDVRDLMGGDDNEFP